MSVSSPTQRALCLPEILLIIFENVLLSKNDSFAARLGFSPASTLASAALVCKVFTAPALITLWRSIDTLVPLVKLLSVAKVVGLDDEDSESDDWDDLDSDNTVLVSHLRPQFVNATLICAALFSLARSSQTTSPQRTGSVSRIMPHTFVSSI